MTCATPGERDHYREKGEMANNSGEEGEIDSKFIPVGVWISSDRDDLRIFCV